MPTVVIVAFGHYCSSPHNLGPIHLSVGGRGPASIALQHNIINFFVAMVHFANPPISKFIAFRYTRHGYTGEYSLA